MRSKSSVGSRFRKRAVAALEAGGVRQVLQASGRVPPDTLRRMTSGRSLRSAGVLVVVTPGMATKAKSSCR